MTAMPRDVAIVDTLLDLRPLVGDSVAHLFRRPILGPEDDGRVGAELVLPHMDRHGIAVAMVEVDPTDDVAVAAVTEHPDRFVRAHPVDPNLGMAGVRALARAHEEGARAATAIPAFYVPAVPIDDRRFYPLYAKCCELGIPIFVTVGVPGPAVPYEPQFVGRLDVVCHDFPELQIVMRHGALPWVDLAVSLMAKWPNLHYSTSAMAPKHYPREVLDFAVKRAPDRLVYAGYFPRGLSLDRIFSELPELPLDERTWRHFLSTNARRLLGLTEAER